MIAVATDHETGVVAAGAVLVMFLWALCFPLISTGLTAAPPMTFATLRAVISGAALLGLAHILRRPRVEGRQMWAGITVVGFTATSIGFFGMFYGGARVSPGIATVIANTQPLIAALLAWGYLNEQLSPVQRLGLGAGFGGVVIIGAPGLFTGDSQLYGTFLITVAAFGIAVSNVVLKRLAGKVDPIRAMGWQLLIGSVPLGVLAVATESPGNTSWSTTFVVNLLVLSVVGTAIAFWLWFSLLQRANLSQLNVYTFLTPIFGIVMGQLFFAEQIHVTGYLGILLSLIGIALVNRSKSAKRGF